MADDAKVEMVKVEKDYVSRLEAEVERLKGERERTASKAALLEERARAEAVRVARRRVLEESLSGRQVSIDASRAAGLLDRLTSNVAAVVDDAGRASVPQAGIDEIREQARLILDAIGFAGGVVSPPIQPGEPPRRGERRTSGGVPNCWDTSAERSGYARGREMMMSAVKELERNGVL